MPPRRSSAGQVPAVQLRRKYGRQLRAHGRRPRAVVDRGSHIRLSVELGRTRITLDEIVGLGAGSVVELAKLEAEPVDILANDQLIAKGEVMVQDGKYGIRILEIVSRRQRLMGLT